MSKELYFGQWLLFITPEAVTYMILTIMAIAVLPTVREKTEGMGYNLAYSSQYGDILLIGAIGIGIEALKRQGYVPGFLGSSTWQVVSLTASLLVSAIWIVNVFMRDQVPGLIADNYHNGIVVPMLMFFGLISIPPVIFTAGYIHPWEGCATLMLLATFLALVVVDWRTGRMNHTVWLKLHKPWVRLEQTIDELEDRQVRAKQTGK